MNWEIKILDSGDVAECTCKDCGQGFQIVFGCDSDGCFNLQDCEICTYTPPTPTPEVIPHKRETYAPSPSTARKVPEVIPHKRETYAPSSSTARKVPECK
jgi:hypothetical protein